MSTTSPPFDLERRRRTARALEEAKLDALVCRLAEHIVLLTGYYPSIGASIVVLPAGGEPIVVAPVFERDIAAAAGIADLRTYQTWQNRFPLPNDNLTRLLGQIAAETGLRGKRIGVEGRFDQFAPNAMIFEPTGAGALTREIIAGAFGDQLLDATDVLYRERAVKTDVEVERIRIANEVASMGMAAFKESVVAGQTEVGCTAAIESAILTRGTGYKGARTARGVAQVISGPATANCWNYPLSTGRRLERGDLVLVELGVCVDGYWADLTRTAVVGPASERQREVYETIVAAHGASLAAVRPGASGVEVDAAGRRIVELNGYGDNFVHHTGHGIGFRYHEPIPFLAPHSTHALAQGHVLSIEPGIYIAGFGGCRIEDICVVTESGGEQLSRTDFGLD